jgi:hypothetical protein
MLLKPQESSLPRATPGKAKQLFLRPLSAEPSQEYIPCFYVEARIDFDDVRTGYHMTCGLHNIMDMARVEDDLLWTKDMVQTVDPARLLTVQPEEARLSPLPAFVDETVLAAIETQYLRYLLRHAEARVMRNFALNIYSAPGETRDEFMARCLDALNDPFRGELEGLREVVNRRLERIEQKYVRADLAGEFESDRRRTLARSRLFTKAEVIAGLFLETELTFDAGGAGSAHYPDPSHSDLEQSLEALEFEARQDIRRLRASYQDRVRNIDEYIIHPGLKDLHLVRTCILWMPAKAQEA